jgi:hypothetical protein
MDFAAFDLLAFMERSYLAEHPPKQGATTESFNVGSARQKHIQNFQPEKDGLTLKQLDKQNNTDIDEVA